jgi:DNA-binding GntR family transcriptional regulator
VREALGRLQHVGIVIKERNKGVTVRRFSAEEVHQIYDVREMLQRQASLMIPLPVPRTKIEALRAIHADYEAAISQDVASTRPMTAFIRSSSASAAMSSSGAWSSSSWI